MAPGVRQLAVPVGFWGPTLLRKVVSGPAATLICAAIARSGGTITVIPAGSLQAGVVLVPMVVLVRVVSVTRPHETSRVSTPMPIAVAVDPAVFQDTNPGHVPVAMAALAL